MQQLNENDYLTKLKRRTKEGRVTRQFQLIGLEIATILKDLKHKALYIKLAKEHDPEKLLSIAKDTSSRRDIKNPGAYFMRVVQEIKPRRQTR